MNESDHPWLTRYAAITAGATFVLIGIGGLVTSKGAGMAVPDWPNTYGYNLFFFPVSHWVGGILYEHTHRLMGALVGLLTTVLASWLWIRETTGKTRWLGLALFAGTVSLLGIRKMPVYYALAGLAVPTIALGLARFVLRRDELRWLGLAAFAAVILQGVLGGLRVTLLADEIGVIHGVLAQSFLVLVAFIAVSTSRWWRTLPPLSDAGARVRSVFLVTTALVLAQLTLGAAMRHRHAGLAVPDFPLAHGRLWPRLDAASIAMYNQQRVEVVAAKPITAFDVALHMAHRVGGFAVLGSALWAVARTRRLLPRGDGLRTGAHAGLALVLAQIGLGAATVWTNKSADLATAHVATGALILTLGSLLTLTAVQRARRKASVQTEHLELRGSPAPALELK